ncbi:MAG: hypothetical protein Q9222_000889 [Ikaeria aurantiellina]
MPAAFGVSSMSGNFDFPPASSYLTAPAATSRRPPNTHNRHAQRPVTNPPGRQVTRASLEHQRRLLEAQLQETEAEINRRHSFHNGHSTTTTQASTFPQGPRPRQMPTNTAFPWLQAREREHRAVRGGSQSLEAAVDRLNQVSSRIIVALDQSASRTASPDIVSQEYSGEAAVNEANRQRAKRRRLNDGLLAKEFGPQYGHRGQVVPGPLRMEIVYCDGGLHECGDQQYCPENVLRNDLSVYCTRSSKCDLVLRHEGGAAFCLQKLVIKAPENGFTAPIQEGMVFVAMDNEGLVRKASHFDVKESPSPSPPSSPSSSPQSPDLLNDRYPALEPSRPGQVGQQRPPSRRRTQDGTQRVIPPPVSGGVDSASAYNDPDNHQQQSSRVYQASRHDVDRDEATDTDRSIDMGHHPVPVATDLTFSSQFNISIDCEEHSDDEEEESSQATLADRHHRDRITSSYDSSDEIDDPDFTHYLHRSGLRRRPTPSTRRYRRRTAPRRIQSDAPPRPDDVSRGAKGTDVLVPHAIIFIEKDKSMVNVKFDPPISGRYILLKFWSPSKDQNIDIQSIVAYGFAGPRYFPAVQTL